MFSLCSELNSDAYVKGAESGEILGLSILSSELVNAAVETRCCYACAVRAECIIRNPTVVLLKSCL